MDAKLLEPLKEYVFYLLKVDPIGALSRPPLEFATPVSREELMSILLKYHERSGTGIYAVKIWDGDGSSIIFTDSKPVIDGNVVRVKFRSILGFTAVPSRREHLFEAIVMNHRRIVDFVDELRGRAEAIVWEKDLDAILNKASPEIIIPLERVISISDHPPINNTSIIPIICAGIIAYALARSLGSP